MVFVLGGFCFGGYNTNTDPSVALDGWMDGFRFWQAHTSVIAWLLFRWIYSFGWMFSGYNSLDGWMDGVRFGQAHTFRLA